MGDNGDVKRRSMRVQSLVQDHCVLTQLLYCFKTKERPIFFICRFISARLKINLAKKTVFAQYGKNTGNCYNMVNLQVKLLHIWCQVLKYFLFKKSIRFLVRPVNFYPPLIFNKSVCK